MLTFGRYGAFDGGKPCDQEMNRELEFLAAFRLQRRDGRRVDGQRRSPGRTHARRA